MGSREAGAALRATSEDAPPDVPRPGGWRTAIPRSAYGAKPGAGVGSAGAMPPMSGSSCKVSAILV